MRKILFFLVIFFAVFSGRAFSADSKNEAMTNQTVVKMVKANLGDSLIIKKIKTSKANFDLSTDGIIALKQAGVSEKVIEAMMGGAGAEEPKTIKEDNKTSTLPADPFGQIWIQKNNKKELMTYSQTEMAMSLTSSFKKSLSTFGFGNSMPDQWFYTKGEKSRLRINETKPVFYIQGDPAANDIKIRLVKLNYHESKGIRYVIVKSPKALKANTEEIQYVDKENNVEVEYEKKDKGIFKVYPKEKMGSGEYAIFHMNKLYDFGVDTQ